MGNNGCAIGNDIDGFVVELCFLQKLRHIGERAHAHRADLLIGNRGIEENLLPLRLLAVLEEDIARNGERLAQALFDRAVEQILTPAEILLGSAALGRLDH